MKGVWLVYSYRVLFCKATRSNQAGGTHVNEVLALESKEDTITSERLHVTEQEWVRASSLSLDGQDRRAPPPPIGQKSKKPNDEVQ